MPTKVATSSQLLAGGIADDTVLLWDVKTGKTTTVLKGHTAPIRSVAFSPDGKRLASCALGHRRPDGGDSVNLGDQAEVKVWDLQSRQELLTFKEHTGVVFCLAFSPDGKRLASPQKVWDAQTGKELLSLDGRTGTGVGQRVTFSPDGKRLASTSGRGTGNRTGDVKVWDAQTGQELLTLQGGGLGVAFSPDGKRLASAAIQPEFQVKLWDAQTGQELLTLKGGGYLQGVAFSPDGNRVASGGKVWDAKSGEELLSLNGDLSIGDFSPNGHRLAGRGRNGTLKIYDATPLPEKP